MLTTIRLGGHLGRRFGREWRLDLDVPSPAEAVRALSAVCAGFKAWVLKHSKPGYHVFVGRKSLREGKELALPTGSGEIHIMPALAGAKSGWLGIIIGSVLIAAGATIDFLSHGTLAYIGNPIIALGVSMVTGGISLLLSAPPPGANTEKSSSATYVFSGPANTTGVGNPVPVLYGKLEIGSQVVSAGISTKSLVTNPIAYNDPTGDPPMSTWHSSFPVPP